MIARREFLGLSAGTLALLASGCGKSGWPEGMVPIKWDRDTCVRCNMLISDRRFAVQAQRTEVANVSFDDIGCALVWLAEQPREPRWELSAMRLWVADITNRGDAIRWLDAKTAHYVTRTSPMNYNQGAVAMAEPGSLPFAEMRAHVLAKSLVKEGRA